MLIDSFKCEPSIGGYHGRTLLHIACSVGHVHLVKILILKYKADVNTQDDQNHTPLQVADVVR